MTDNQFHIDLTDTASCGVYTVATADMDTIAAEASGDEFNVHHIDLAGCRDHAAFTRSMVAGWPLSADDTRDWDSLVAYLKDMEGLPSRGHIVLMHHPDEWQRADPDALDAVLDVLEDTAAIWAGEGVAFFVFLAFDTQPAPTAA